MSRKSLKQLIQAKDRFIAVAEFVPLPGHKLSNFEKFLVGYAEKGKSLPGDVVLDGVTVPQSPSGIASMSPTDIWALLDKKGLWGDLEMIPHVTCKDMNRSAIVSYLVGLKKMGITTLLALTGDKPAEGKGVFEIDSVGLISLIREMNNDSLAQAQPGKFDQAHQFYTAAAVSQYKYTEATQMQQYFKMGKKVQAGADCLITQLGWDWRKCEELFRYMREENINVPVIGNVYLLTTLTPAPRLMYQGDLPGCVVTKELFDKVISESPKEHIERAAQQVAMYRDLGAAGVDIGGLFDFDMLLEILDKAAKIGSNWREYQANLDFGVKNGFYLYPDGQGRGGLSRPGPTMSKRSFDMFHKTFLEPGRGLHGTLKKTLGKSKSLREGKGVLYKWFFADFEKPVKTMLFDCEECGDCFLVENFGVCSMGKCEKGLANPPCGDANPDGTCGNDETMRCVGELIYEAAASEGPAGLQRLARRINPQRDPQLEGTSSILNYLFNKDHTKKVNLIQIGESIHASIPKPGAAMKELLALGPDAFDKSGGPLDYIISLIDSQIAHRVDFIEINVDALGEDDPQIAVEMMRKLVRLLRRHSRGVPPCVDSSNDEVLIAGLEEWYQNAPADLAVPVLNSVKTYTMDNMLPRRAKYPYKAIGLLVDDKAGTGQQTSSAEDLHRMARTIYDAAVGKYGFKPDDLFFDTTVFPLAIDMPMMPDQAGFTYRAFEAIRRIMNDPAMKGVHTSLGVSNCVKDLPGRKIGVCRAYLAKAQEYGLDAAIVNVLHDYGLKPVDPDLMELVSAFAAQDGSAEANNKAMQIMGDFCRANRKASV
jgi:5-methyltetrahydrofolate corrinoid/iron sulfur protein methyltransferase